jgi:hypothetical protein
MVKFKYTFPEYCKINSTRMSKITLTYVVRYKFNHRKGLYPRLRVPSKLHGSFDSLQLFFLKK